ncbi:MAG: carbon-nitrogen hydrolase family protein [Spirochaetales bacterium]|nr:carbon-nitrogen hydrolase family protein [Spirochaetales bacterium]
MKAAATQMNIILGDVEKNFNNAVNLINNAAQEGAELIVLPEFFTSGIAINPIINNVHKLNNQFGVLEKLKDLSARLKIIISGSILNKINKDVYNSIFIIEPDGQLFIHNKDYPTQFENCYYTSGDDNRSYKNFGVAFCWEMLRTKTIKELSQDVQLLLCGSSWWDLPVGSTNDELRKYNHDLNFLTPQKIAKVAGVPVVHSSLKGVIEGEKSLEDNRLVKRKLIGTTQIINASGNILSSITDNDQNNYIIEDLKLDKRVINPVENNFWLTKLRDEYLRAWETQNKLGRKVYDERKKSENL